MQPASPPPVVICGAGVIGAATAYFLSLRGAAAILVERTGVACAASGKAGGFLALDWCDGTPLDALARKSFELHAELARSLGTDYGYRRMSAYAALAGAGVARGGNSGETAWLDRDCRVLQRLAAPATAAQVHPERFTQALVAAAIQQGARLITGRVEGVVLEGEPPKVRGVRVAGAEIAASAVVIAMGPWSIAAAAWLPLPRVGGLKGHSIVLRPPSSIPAHALFLDYGAENGERYTPEVYPRADGTVYLNGLSDPGAVLPNDPAAVTPQRHTQAFLQGVAACLSSRLAGVEAERVQACFRPLFADGLPRIGPVAGVEGAYLATGHNVWGILNAPATGLALAELMLEGGARTVDLAPFDPRR